MVVVPSINKHRCPYCESRFTLRHSLEEHLLSHGREKSSACQSGNYRNGGGSGRTGRRLFGQHNSVPNPTVSPSSPSRRRPRSPPSRQISGGSDYRRLSGTINHCGRHDNDRLVGRESAGRLRRVRGREASVDGLNPKSRNTLEVLSSPSTIKKETHNPQ